MKIIRIALLILHLGVLILLLGTLLNASIPPKVFPWMNLLSLGFPILMIIYFILIIFWILSWKKRAFVFMFFGLFLLNATRRWVNYNIEAKEKPNLKILTFNIKGGRYGQQKIEDFLNSQNADIVLLQEDGNKNFNLKNLKQSKPTSTISLYTHYKIVDKKNLVIGGDTEDDNGYVTQTDVEINNKVYRIINCYLQPFKFKKNLIKINDNRSQNEETLKYIVKKLLPIFKVHQTEIDIVKMAIEESPYPVIVAGDFNAVPNSYEYFKINNILQDPFMEVGRGDGTSFHDYRFPIRIDYIFASKKILPINYTINRTEKMSDHYPVIAEFLLN